MVGLSGVEMIPVAEGDVDDGEVDIAFRDWCDGVIRVLKRGCAQETNGVSQNGVVESDGEYIDSTNEKDENNDADIVDLEDIAGKASSKKNGLVKVSNGDGKKEMVTPVIRASLTKQVLFDCFGFEADLSFVSKWLVHFLKFGETCRAIKSLVHIVELKYVDGQSHNLEEGEVATSTP